ncbi:MAG: hypothetical protein GF383_08590 [Candidatus Lokiarchaeota archaeon]|nr:hypothetical protein [Candidatus Lokiarchaeota archaeon]MBD3340439.1 hypothetical protein [Candidatus Lokiarchaeota archaeon]
MPIKINGQKFYRTKEALDRIGISRPTWFRWIRDNVVEDVKHTDRRGWRLFTDDDIQRLSSFANSVQVKPEQKELNLNR